MNNRIYFSRLSTTSFFCGHELKIGDPLFRINENEVGPINKAPFNTAFVGVSERRMIKIDLATSMLPSNALCLGSKISILQSGVIIKRFKKSLKIPYGQYIYVDQNNELTWRYSPWLVGTTYSDQDEDGFIKIEIHDPRKTI